MPEAFVHKILLKHSTENYNLEYKRFLVNHVSHGIIALNHLGASEEQIEDWCAAYMKKDLEPVDGKPASSPMHYDPDAPPFDEKNVDSLIGKRCHFGPLMKYYKKKLDSHGGSIEKFVTAEFPKFLEGIGANLHHPVIQLGYGLSVADPQIVLEGMVYLHTTDYKPKLSGEELARPFGEGNDDIFTILNDITNDTKLREDCVAAGNRPGSWRGQGSIGNIMVFMFQERAAEINAYVNRLQFPKEACGSNPDKKAVLDFVQATMLRFFTSTVPSNDFVILHLVTGAWSTMQVMKLFDDPKMTITAARAMLLTMVFMHIVQKCHELHQDKLVPRKELGGWDEIVKKTLERPGYQDEHFYKLVQVAKDLATTAPAHDDLCRAAADIGLQNDKFFFGFTL